MNQLVFVPSGPLTSLRDFDSLLAKPTNKNRFSYFDEYLARNREHQNAALLAAKAATRGQIISPCGTGKTRIQICLHVATLIELTRQEKCGITVIASHRLALNRQLCDELVDVMIHCGLSFDILCVGSDSLDTEKYYNSDKYDYTKDYGYSPETSRHLGSLDSKEIERFIQKAHLLGRHVLVVSTYHSIERLQNVGTIDLLTHDEAHNTINAKFTKKIMLVKPNAIREYFFTATRRGSEDDEGMNNTEFYGEILIDILAQDMLEKGEIACPRIHSIEGTNEETTSVYDTHMYVKSVIEAFEEHKKLIRKFSLNHGEIGAKIIVGCAGIENMDEIYNHPDFRSWAEKAGVSCFTISSKGGGECCINWDNTVTKRDFFDTLKELQDSKDALIFNVDMLSEGIDLPTITGVMLGRNLGKTKLIQLLGRALRLTYRDRALLYSGDITPCDYSKYVKPFGFLIIPRHFDSCYEFKRMEENVKDIYQRYGTPFEELIIQDKYVDLVPNDLPPMTKSSLGGGKDYKLTHNISEVVNNIYEGIFDEVSYKGIKDYLVGDESF